jgi:sugar phosphate isomerase/epimerase
MRRDQIAAQLYTVREHMQNPRDIVSGLRRIKSIGYGAVQVSGIGPMPTADLARALRDEGLTCCATHEPASALFEETETVVDRLKALDCEFTAYPYPGGVKFDRVAEVRALASQLNEAGRRLADAGLTLGYHNHQIEFRRLEGRTVLDWIFAETDPRWLKAELDTYWVQVGGGDPATWIRRLTGRIPTLHLKDYAINPRNEVVFAEVGEGNLDWPGIVRAADEAGCRWFIVEQDTCPGNPFDSLRRSLAYLEEHLCST